MAAPITFNTALPVGKSAFINREQVVIRPFDHDVTEAGRDLDVAALISVLGYGVTPKFALFAALPYLDKDLRVTAGGERVTRSSTGLGDLRVFGRYTLHQDDAKNRTFRVAGFAGVKAPIFRRHVGRECNGSSQQQSEGMNCYVFHYKILRLSFQFSNLRNYTPLQVIPQQSGAWETALGIGDAVLTLTRPLSISYIPPLREPNNNRRR